MIDPATTDALRAIASMMRMDGYRTDAIGVEALVLDNAAADIEALQAELKYRGIVISDYSRFIHSVEEDLKKVREENKKLRKTVEYYALESNWEYWLKNQSIASIRAWQTLEELK